MTKLGRTLSRSAFASSLVLGAMPALLLAGDLSKYRNFQLGTDLAAVATQAGANSSQAKLVHSRPALIQELEWSPQPLGPSSRTESAKNVVFRFYNGELYRIEVKYDRYEIEGLTAEDVADAVSVMYGPAVRLVGPVKAAHGRYGDQEEVLAQWQDLHYRFDLIRSSYGPSFSLIGVLKRLEAPAQAAILEAARLDEQEAPERDAARIASERQAATAELEKARLVNKPRFRP